MKLPIWANQALEVYRPMSPHGAMAPNAERLAAWDALRDRLARRWHELDAERWRVPDNSTEPDRVRQTILELAIACAMDCHKGKSPARSNQLLNELDRLNEQINASASALAKLVCKRQELMESEGLDDWDSEDADPLNLWAWLASLDQAPPEAGRLISLGLGSSREMPGLIDLLDAIAQRYPAKASPLFGVDRREFMSRKQVGWAPWAIRLMVGLERSGWIHGVNLLDCLTPERLSALLCVCLDAPLNDLTPDAIKQLRARHIRKRSRSGGDDSN